MLKEFYIYDYIDEKFKKDRDIALLAIIGKNPLLDSHVDDGKKPTLNTFDLESFYYSKNNIFKNDRDFVIDILKYNSFFMENIEPHFKKDKEFLLTALKKSDSHFKAPKVSSPFVTMIDESLKKDKAFIARVLKIEPRLFKYIDESLQKDREIIALIEEIKHPLWKKIFTPLNILLVFLFGYWWRESKKRKKEQKCSN